METQSPVEQLGENSGKILKALIDDFLSECSLRINYLLRLDKRLLVEYLYSKGAFNYRKAVSIVASKVKMSRATVYNYLLQLGDL